MPFPSSRTPAQPGGSAVEELGTGESSENTKPQRSDPRHGAQAGWFGDSEAHSPPLGNTSLSYDDKRMSQPDYEQGEQILPRRDIRLGSDSVIPDVLCEKCKSLFESEDY